MEREREKKAAESPLETVYTELSQAAADKQVVSGQATLWDAAGTRPDVSL